MNSLLKTSVVRFIKYAVEHEISIVLIMQKSHWMKFIKMVCTSEVKVIYFTNSYVDNVCENFLEVVQSHGWTYIGELSYE